MATQTLNVLLTGDATSMQKSFASATSAAGKAKIGIAAAAVGAGMALKALYDVGEEFDTAFDTIRVGTGKTGKQLDRLKNDFKNVVSSVPTDFEPAAEAIVEINSRLQLTGKPLRRLSKQFLELSRITDTDVGENIKTVTRAFGDWEVKTKNQEKVLDTFFRASQLSGASVSELADIVVKFGSPLRQFGFGLDEATAMFASFEKAGVNIQTMVPGIKVALKTFLEEGKDPGKALQQTFKGIEDGSIKSARALKIFGGRAGADMIEAVEQGRFHLGKFTAQIANGNDTIRKAGTETQDANEKLQLLGNKLKVLIEPAATAVFTAVGKLADKLAHLNFNKLARDLGTSKKDLREFGAAVADIFKRVAPIVGNALDHAAQFLKHFFGVVRGVVKVISSLLKGDFAGAWRGVKQIFSEGIQATIQMLLGITAPIRAIGGKIGEALGSAFSAAWRGAKAVFRDGVNGVIDLLNTMIGLINKLPFVELGEIGHVGGGGGGRKGSTKLHQQHRAAGGFIVPGYGSGDIVDAALPPGSFVMNKKATAHYGLAEGGLMPVKLEPRERVFLPHEVRSIGQSRLQSLNDSVPRFSIGGALSDVSGAVAGAARDVAGMGLGAILSKLPNPSAVLPGWLAGFGDYLKSKLVDWVKGESAQAAGPTGGVRGPKGVGTWMGVPMANWVIQALEYAAKQGVQPQPTSGYRSHAQNVAEGRSSYFSEHEKTQYPGGAVDFGGYHDPAAKEAKMAVVGATRGFKYPLLAPIGFVDDGHASGTGHMLGGVIQALAGGGMVSGKVSWFSGGSTAGGRNTSEPGMALNLHPGTEAGWNNETTQAWRDASLAGHPVYGAVTIAGHHANLPITDMGPAASTGRAIDITEGGVFKLGFTTSNFPTDATGTVRIMGGPSVAGGAGAKKKSPPASKRQKHRLNVIQGKAQKVVAEARKLKGQYAKYGGTPKGKAALERALKLAKEAAHEEKVGNSAHAKTLIEASQSELEKSRSALGAAEAGVFQPGLKPTPLLPSAAGLGKDVQARLKARGLTYAGKLAIGEQALSEAEGTETKADDEAVLAFQRELLQRRNKGLQKKLHQVNKELGGKQTKAQRQRSLGRRAHIEEELASVEGGLANVRSSSAALGEGGEGEETDAERQAREAIEAQTKAAEELAQAIEEQKAEQEALRKEMELTRHIAESELGTAAEVAKRALADIIAGQLGPRSFYRAQTAGAGSVGTL
jgi:TP901 family phage tail tape measure protein